MSGRIALEKGPCGERVGSIDATPEEPASIEGRRLNGVWVKWLIRGGEARAFAIRVYRLEPGSVIPRHRHPWEHGIVVLEGEGVVRVGRSRYVLKSGDYILIPPNAEHEFVNVGGKDWIFICVIPAKPTVDAGYDPCGQTKGEQRG